MTSAITLKDVRQAQTARDPGLADLVVALAGSDDPTPRQPVRDGAMTPSMWASEIKNRRFARLPAEERAKFRIERMRALEAEGAEVELPDRWRLYTVILDLWSDGSAWARRQLLDVIARVPLRYGPWRALKAIFKAAEAAADYEVFGALAARLDREFAERYRRSDVTRKTLGYLVRRAWRFLRRTAESLPAVYADAAVEVLRFYPEETAWRTTWIANHVFYHDTGDYTRRRFKLARRPSTMLKHRAYPELWRRSPRPLFALLEQAQSDQARRFAIDALKSDFRAALREVEPSWVKRLVAVHSRAIDSFAVWLLDNVPRFEQGALRGLELHETVLSLLDSPADDARAWAARYARTHARDLSLDALIHYADNDSEEVRAMARDLIAARDPREAVGVEGWGRLLATRHGFDFAAAALRKHFTARDLGPDWFAARLRADDRRVVQFAATLLPTTHPPKSLGARWFVDLLEADALRGEAATFATEMIEKFPVDALDAEVWRRLLLNPNARRAVRRQVEEGRLKAEVLGADFLKAIADRPTWEADAGMTALRAGPAEWARALEFDEGLASFALKLLSDVRLFTPDQLGFDWLMGMVERTDAQAHDFAVGYMTKAFVPADFAPKAASEAAEASAGDGAVDLGGATFLFTGKLATMTRGVAEKKVTDANGVNSAGVSAKLDYLVIGDEGSPLYGAGRKGSKQTKAESLNKGGAGIRIISETAFLQMLAGKQRQVDDDSTERGCEQLWQMLTGEGAPDSPLSRFARHYIRLHHEDICPAETDRYVDPGAEIPASFLSFARVRGLLADRRAPLRALGIELARWSLATWDPPLAEIVSLFELPYPDLRAFLTDALTAADHPDSARYRLDPARLTADAVYRFCESLDEATRALGMTLIAQHPRLAVPEELFRLTESPDRRVRAFVVAQLWRLYRDRGITRHWKPTPPPQTTVGRRKAKVVDVGEGPPPRPEAPPAEPEELRGFLRRTLFGIPPARLPKAREEQRAEQGDDKGGTKRLKPLSAHAAKKALIEVVRDLAVEDATFAAHVVAPLRVFTRSRGLTERAACIVALARIRAAHPALVIEEAA
ncbi:MAG: BRCT domain-containing protein [bacterium]